MRRSEDASLLSSAFEVKKAFRGYLDVRHSIHEEYIYLGYMEPEHAVGV